MSTANTVHVWHYCHWCGAAPISGFRYTCLTCPVGPDNDLCASCHAKLRLGYFPRLPTAQSSRHVQHAFRSFEGEVALRPYEWLDVPQAHATAPQVHNGFLVRPEFQAGEHLSFGSYGFVVEISGRRLFLTALHVLDEISKLLALDLTAETYTGDELPRLITRVVLYDVLEEKWLMYPLGSASEMLPLRNARSGDDEPYSHRDLCAFRVDNADGLAPGKLARPVPKVGEPVWLAAATNDGRRQQSAVVVEHTDRTFIFRYDDAIAGPKATSGAPILDSSGAVVAINAGSGVFGGHSFGHANHVASIREHLAECGYRSPSETSDA
jgi:hypothetical protein